MVRHCLVSPNQTLALLNRKLNLVWAELRDRITIDLSPQYFTRLVAKVKILRDRLHRSLDLRSPTFLETSMVYTTEHYSLGVPYSLFRSARGYTAVYLDLTPSIGQIRPYLPMVNNILHHAAAEHVATGSKLRAKTIVAQTLEIETSSIFSKPTVDQHLDSICDGVMAAQHAIPSINCKICICKDICKWKYGQD